MTYPRHHTIDHYLNKVRLHREPYWAEVLGKKLIVFPNVMSPKYDRSAQIFIPRIPFTAGRFLDMGSGTGIVSLFAADGGVSTITAVDINPAAVANTKANFELHGTQNTEVLESDLFSKVTGTFDTIFFNAPFHGNEAADILELGTSDSNYQVLRRFFGEVPKRLSPHGRLYLGFSDMGDNDLVRNLVKENGLEITSIQEEQNGDWTALLYTIEAKGGISS